MYEIHETLRSEIRQRLTLPHSDGWASFQHQGLYVPRCMLRQCTHICSRRLDKTLCHFSFWLQTRQDRFIGSTEVCCCTCAIHKTSQVTGHITASPGPAAPQQVMKIRRRRPGESTDCLAYCLFVANKDARNQDICRSSYTQVSRIRLPSARVLNEHGRNCGTDPGSR